MLTQSQAKIVSWSAAGEEVCASAARISTIQGDALALFEKAQGNPRNQDLIGKVLRSGHRSVIEHAVFSIALQNVSVYVEQYFIERRLASFTVKSRRYVDFSGLGYYIPPELEGKALAGYKSYMDGLFAAYQRLLDADVPKEDARFLLPYAFCSNFYCTLNARELVSLIQSIRAGQGGAAPELQDIAEQLAEQLNERFPALGAELESGRPGGPWWSPPCGRSRWQGSPSPCSGRSPSGCRKGRRERRSSWPVRRTPGGFWSRPIAPPIPEGTSRFPWRPCCAPGGLGSWSS